MWNNCHVCAHRWMIYKLQRVICKIRKSYIRLHKDWNTGNYLGINMHLLVVTSWWLEWTVLRLLRANRTVILQKVVDLSVKDHFEESPNTLFVVHMIVRDIGSGKSVRILFLSEVNKIKGLKWAKTLKKCTMDNCQTNYVQLSNESHFQLHHADRGMRIWQKQPKGIHAKWFLHSFRLGRHYDGFRRVFSML